MGHFFASPDPDPHSQRGAYPDPTDQNQRGSGSTTLDEIQVQSRVELIPGNGVQQVWHVVLHAVLTWWWEDGRLGYNTGCWPPPPFSSRAARAGRNHLNELSTPLVPLRSESDIANYWNYTVPGMSSSALEPMLSLLISEMPNQLSGPSIITQSGSTYT